MDNDEIEKKNKIYDSISNLISISESEFEKYLTELIYEMEGGRNHVSKPERINLEKRISQLKASMSVFRQI